MHRRADHRRTPGCRDRGILDGKTVAFMITGNCATACDSTVKRSYYNAD
jgi:hypothetical protein